MNDTDNELHLKGGINLSMHGAYRIQVVDYSTKSVVKDYGWHKNLILNSGMDAVASTVISVLTSVGICGTGSRSNSITSSTSQISQSDAQIYLMDASGLTDFTSSIFTNGTMSYAAAAQVGDVIIDSDNSQSMITSVSVDGVNLFVNVSQSFSTGKTFTIWKTSQTGLQGEVHRSATYNLVGSSSLVGWNQGSEISCSTIVNRRTYDFVVETATRSYTEVGVSWTGTSFGGVFSRALLPVSISIAPSQQLRMTYDLSVTYGPTLPVYKTASIVGWPVFPSTSTIGSESIQNFVPSRVNTNGGNAGTVTGVSSEATCLDPGATNTFYGGSTFAQFTVFASTNSTPLYTGSVGVGNATARTGDFVIGSLSSYVVGSYERYKTATLAITQNNSTSLRSIGFGLYNYSGGTRNTPNDTTAQAMTFIFDEPQTKTNLQTLTLTWKWNWYRVIQ